jgi:hypothetical protein
MGNPESVEITGNTSDDSRSHIPEIFASIRGYRAGGTTYQNHRR